jgi:hypothetical protein
MRKEAFITGLVLLVLAVTLFTGCVSQPPEQTIGPLFNETVNQQIENLTNTSNVPKEEFKEFYFNYTARPEAKYEIARDDIFTLSKGNFTSTEISFLGVMLGDSLESVIERVGSPDVIFTPADNSYKNLEYRNMIGISGKYAGISYHFEKNKVTIINIKPSFNKYLHGNTSIGVPKDIIYALLDIPDYQSLFSSYRVFYYAEKGIDIYLKSNDINRMSFYQPYDFKGVEYVKVEEDMGDGIVLNVTKPIPIR